MKTITSPQHHRRYHHTLTPFPLLSLCLSPLQVCQTPQWLRGRTGKEIELQSFLGPFFALSSINDAKIVGSPTSVFSRHVIKTRRDEERAKDDLRTRLKAVQVLSGVGFEREN